MTILREAAQQALEALKSCSGVPHWPALQPTIDNLRAALAQEQAEPVQEPVAWMVYTEGGTSAYVTDNPNDLKEGQSAYALYPGPFERQPLTEEASSRLCDEYQSPRQLVRAVERVHGIVTCGDIKERA